MTSLASQPGWRKFGLICLCLAVGGISGWVTRPEIVSWYSTLQKPTFNPPNWVFGPVWTLIYTLLGITAANVWEMQIQGSYPRLPRLLFFVLLGINSLWSALFFGLHRPDLAFIDIIAYIVVLGQWMRLIGPAARLQIPHLLWVLFATVLNFSIWWLNR